MMKRASLARGVYRNRLTKDRDRSAFEILEARQLFSATALMTPTFIEQGRVAKPADTAFAAAPFSPAEVRTAYGVDSISFNGTTGTGAGQTIAIVDAYNEPNIVADANAFSSTFGLQQFNVSGGPTFNVLGQTGSTALPADAVKNTWDVEIALDVEWAHAMAPMANIVLFEAQSNSSANLYAAARTAAKYSGVSVVSMSFGASESSGESGSDSTFLTPTGHQGVTFVASAGDSGTGALYPSASPNVVSVGGTSLQINADDTYNSETTWAKGGGGISAYESQPSYQSRKVNNLTATKRATPDVSMLADPNTGVYVLDSYYSSAYLEVGGTSLAAPMIGGLVAVANQGRSLQGLSTLNGATQTLPMLYTLPGSDFNDITTGNNGQNAMAGYDLATGLGTPIANLLVPGLAGYSVTAPSPTQLAFAQQPTSSPAGIALSPSVVVDVESANGSVVTGDTSAVTLTILSGPTGGAISGIATESAANGAATFDSLSFTKAGTYTLSATDGSLTSATSASFTITATAASKVVFVQQPTSTTSGKVETPAVTVAVEDAFGNVVTTDNSIVTLSIATGPTGGAITGTTSATAASGIATFSNLSFATAGAYTLTAADVSLSSATSNSFTITAPAVATGGSVSGSVLVGSAGLAKVSVYLDANNNSKLDTGERSTTTAGNGTYSFTGAPAGAYIVRQLLPSGYHQVTPTNNTGDHVTVSNGSTLTGQNFTDAANTITGSIKTASGAGVANATVYLDLNNNSVLDSTEIRTTTNAGGAYTFTAVPNGAYVVRQVVPSGYTQTSPASNYGIHVTVTATAYTFTNENFTDASTGPGASIAGTVFNDANGNLKLDTGEAGLANWTVYFDANNNGVLDSAEVRTTTSSTGAYHFTGLAAGNYLVRVVRPSNYKQTTPTNNYGQHVTLSATQAVTGELFGEKLITA